MLELLDKLCQIGMSFPNLVASHTALNDNPYAMHELAEIPPVLLGKKHPKERRSKAKEI
jgi:hypothetical protein